MKAFPLCNEFAKKSDGFSLKCPVQALLMEKGDINQGVFANWYYWQVASITPTGNNTYWDAYHVREFLAAH